MRSATVVAVIVTWIGFLGCGGSQSPTEAPTATPPTPEPAAEPSPAGTDDSATRPQLTAEACESSGGAVVGDIGDGAVHRPDYLCPSGKKPSGAIRAPEGGPIAVEGSVCCPK